MPRPLILNHGLESAKIENVESLKADVHEFHVEELFHSVSVGLGPTQQSVTTDKDLPVSGGVFSSFLRMSNFCFASILLERMVAWNCKLFYA
jgi:hypothetical protein